MSSPSPVNAPQPATGHQLPSGLARLIFPTVDMGHAQRSLEEKLQLRGQRVSFGRTQSLQCPTKVLEQGALVRDQV